ncbi:GntR family transcriptional regulator [Herbidospora sp. NEAU-GS84]|uniref:GntR family transcriptional regulator n=1 Tax=Herbidospora solisilvae TaxID=2696284 RepID=A0A7C9J8C4_9ACTN|nr:GntR family transcriptional regulator [Herbidospora solisilvae]NAS22388.1 GntR family transcriptional regulator [Herbidospora solisilvae]
MAYQRIASIIKDRVQACVYPDGALLPSEAALCREFGVARSTIRRALGLLESEGLIVVIPAKGRAVKKCLRAPQYLYSAIAADLRRKIRDRELRMGDIIPSEAALCRRYAVSRYTIRQALALLQSDGLIAVKAGSGRFVCPYP